MDDEREITANEINRLYDFLDGLQASGYTIDTRQYLALSDLLMLLIAHGDPLGKLPLKTLIAPLICSSPAEQQDFYQRFDQWYPILFPIEQESTLIDEDITLLPGPKRKWILPSINRTAIFRVVGAAATISLIIWLAIISVMTGIQVNGHILLYSLILLFIGFVSLLSWRLWSIYQENQYITRELAVQEPVYTKVPVKAYTQDVMPILKFKPIVSALRRRVQIPFSEIDVEQTIEKALIHNNWLEIIYRQRQAIPEYLVLIDRKSRLDQQAWFVQEVLAKLGSDGVWLHQYEFDSDPRICFPLDKRDSPLLLKELKSRLPDARLLIFSDIDNLINPITGYLQDWIGATLRWQERAILTPGRIHTVLFEELQSRDFAILPMNLDGIASIARAFESNNYLFQLDVDPKFPAQLLERPMRWTGRDSTSENEINALLFDLKNYLGDNGYYWLCATAVYPELRWELTLYLGSALKSKLETSLLSISCHP